MLIGGLDAATCEPLLCTVELSADSCKAVDPCLLPRPAWRTSVGSDLTTDEAPRRKEGRKADEADFARGVCKVPSPNALLSLLG